MTKFANCVRFVVKPGCIGEYLNSFEAIEPFEGLESHHVAQTGDRTFVSFGVWESEEAIAAARPSMIAFLDTIRDLLEEISPELGVTDPVSGKVVHTW